MKKQILKLKNQKSSLMVGLLVALTLSLVSCEESMDETKDAGNEEISIMDVLKGAPMKGTSSIAEIAIEAGFSELVGALTYVDEELDAGLVNIFLNGTDQYTVFAPGDEAFEALYEALDIDMISDLPAELVLDVLMYHVTEGRRAANSVVPKKNVRTIETLLESKFMVTPAAEIIAIGNTASILAADVSARNGIIHVIDAVILPIEIPSDDDSAKKAGKGKGNGVGDLSIAGIAIEAGFSELVGALVYVDNELDAGLVDLFMNGKDQYTVFAPGNDAFEALYEALDVDMISDLPAELVLDVLLYHVTEGRRGANSVVPVNNVRKIETLLGESFMVDTDATINAIGNTAGITAADISASNGIIHIIDSVILPIE